MYSTEKLKEIRKKQSLTIYDMASKLGISAANYSQIENKKRGLSYESAVKISGVFNMKPDEIFYISK